MRKKIIVIDGDEKVATTLQRALQSEGHEVEIAIDIGEAAFQMAKTTFDVIIVDVFVDVCLGRSDPDRLEKSQGFEFLKQLRGAKPGVPVVVISRDWSPETAIHVIRLGAVEYLSKPFDMRRLIEVVNKATSPDQTDWVFPEGHTSSATLIGQGDAMQELHKELGRIAHRRVNVLIRGETGTGKELVARAIYTYSDRSQQPFVVVNCAAIPENLLESELFGHEAGAFTDAKARRIGKFEQANRGIIVLDEIGDLKLELQGKLLRVLQSGIFQRVGGNEDIQVDVRVFAATHQDLEQAVVDGEFREDLYYRLKDAVITLPPLRERKDDIPDLISFFLCKYGPNLGSPKPRICSKAIQFLQGKLWPGNVRELESVIRRALIQGNGSGITLEIVQRVCAPENGKGPSTSLDRTLSHCVAEAISECMNGQREDVLYFLIHKLEKEVFKQAFSVSGQRIQKTADITGVSYPCAKEKLTAYGLLAPKTKLLEGSDPE